MRIDWFRVITALEAEGLTLRSQADYVGVAPGTVYYWKSGGEPRHHTGTVLLQLYSCHIASDYPTLQTPST